MTHQYLTALQTVLDQGTRKPNRTGVDTISTFGVPMRFDLRQGFPLLTTKKINWFHIVAENLWHLSGEPHIDFLKKHGIKFWDAWADTQGKVPSAYGNFWRHFPVPEGGGCWDDDLNDFAPRHIEYNDQTQWIVDKLRKNPMSRRLVQTAWAPGNAQTSKLPPCHVLSVFNVQNLRARCRCSQCGNAITEFTAACGPTHAAMAGETEPHLCLHLTQRSCDMFLGVPYNIAGYAFILSVVAHLTGLKPGIFAHTLVDAHLYTAKPDGTMAAGGTHGEDDNKLLDHVPLAKEQLTRRPGTPPTLTIDPSIKELSDITKLLGAPRDEILDVFKLEHYDPRPAIKGAVAI